MEHGGTFSSPMMTSQDFSWMSLLTLEWPTALCNVFFHLNELCCGEMFILLSCNNKCTWAALFRHLQHDFNDEHFVTVHSCLVLHWQYVTHCSAAVLQDGVTMWSESGAVSGVSRTSHHQLTAACCPLHGYTRSAGLTLTASLRGPRMLNIRTPSLMTSKHAFRQCANNICNIFTFIGISWKRNFWFGFSFFLPFFIRFYHLMFTSLLFLIKLFCGSYCWRQWH